MRLNSIGIIFLVGTICLFESAVAQEAENEDSEPEGKVLEEVLVTASRRTESLQDASISVSAMTGDFLNKVGAQTLDDYMAYVPSVNAASNTAGERGGLNIVIRGVSNTRIALGDASLLTATTGFYINDVPITAIDTQLFDVQRIEVLRGPQGTLYGASSQGGAVKLFLNNANVDEYEAAVEGSYSFIDEGGNGTDLHGMVSIPVSEGVFGIRVVGEYRARDGFIDTYNVPLNNLTGQIKPPSSYVPGLTPATGSRAWTEDSNTRDTTGVSVSALYTPNDDWTVEFTHLWQLTENGDVNWVDSRFGGAFEQEKYILEPNQSDTALSILNIGYEFDKFRVVSNSGYYTREYDEIIDFTLPTFNGDRFNQVLDYIPAPATLETEGSQETFTQEIRIESNRSEYSNSIMSRLDWVIGAFYMDSDRDFNQIQGAPGWTAAAPDYPLALGGDVRSIATSNYKEGNESIFLDLTYNFTERLAIGGGIRFYDLSTDFYGLTLNAQNPVVPLESIRSFSEDGNSLRFGASYDISDAFKIYANYGDGFRLGGAEAPINYQTNPLCAAVIEEYGLEEFASGRFGSDDVETYEIGIKSGFADGRVTLNASAYTTEWSGLQSQIRLGDISPVCFNVITANVGVATIDGFELEFAALAWEDLYLQGSLAYTDAVIDDPGLSPFKEGDRILNVPEWSGSFVARYEKPTDILSGNGAFFMQGDVRYIGERLPTTGSTDPRLVLDPYTLVGARLGVVYGNEKPITLTLWASNLLNDRMELNSRLKIGVPSTVDNMGLTRTYGITLRKDF
jgi:iron complex outermembrane receptor protein